MIRVVKDFNAVPTYLVNGGISHRHHSIQAALRGIYSGKCCYCEQNEREDFDVEHYRPQNTPNGHNPVHNGYPWLVLEWSNLLWSCSTCNRGVGGKFSKFPIANAANRITASSPNPLDNRADSAYMLAEEALLIHPEIDDPEQFLSVEPSGKLISINNNLRGLATINVCNLNRDSLWLDFRKERIDNICKQLKIELEKAIKIITEHRIENDDIGTVLFIQLCSAFDELNHFKASNQKFALLHRVFYNNFDTFFDANMHINNILSENNKSAIKQAFAHYKSSHHETQ